MTNNPIYPQPSANYFPPVNQAPDNNKINLTATTTQVNTTTGTNTGNDANFNQSNQGNQTPPAKPKSKSKLKYILGGVLLVLLLAGATAGYFLTQQEQDIRQQASTASPESSYCDSILYKAECQQASCTWESNLVSCEKFNYSQQACATNEGCGEYEPEVEAKCKGEYTPEPKDCSTLHIKECSTTPGCKTNAETGTCTGTSIPEKSDCSGLSIKECSITPGCDVKKGKPAQCPGQYDDGKCKSSGPSAPPPAPPPASGYECFLVDKQPICVGNNPTDVCVDGTGVNKGFACYVLAGNMGQKIAGATDKNNKPACACPAGASWLKYEYGNWWCFNTSSTCTPPEGDPTKYQCKPGACSPSGGDTPPPPSGPACRSITSSISAPKIGEQVTFTCGEVNEADHYIFRIKKPDSTYQDLTATGRISEPFNITVAGDYSAQCQICTGSDAKTCLPWENN